MCTLIFLGLASVAAGIAIYAQYTPERGISKKPVKQEESVAMPEIITSPSGLKYSILNHGTGETTPTPGSVVTVNYTGWLDDGGKPGKQFDSSVGRRPFSFIVGAGTVIKGWDEGVLEMRVGEKRRLIIPPQLGYGEGGYPGAIPPNATLIFDVELISIK